MDYIRQYGEDDFDFGCLERLMVYVMCGEKKGFREGEGKKGLTVEESDTHTEDGGLDCESDTDIEGEGKKGLAVEEGDTHTENEDLDDTVNECLDGEDNVHKYEVGSGFIIFNDGQYSLLVTSAHIIDQATLNDDYKIFVSFSGEEGGQEAFILGELYEDIALLVTRCNKKRGWLDISDASKFDMGMPLYMSSYAGGMKRITSISGQLCSKKVNGTMLMSLPHASSFFEMWIGADGGSSGAAIVDDSMRLVGMMSCCSLSDIYIDPQHASNLQPFNLKAAGDLKYGVHADKLRTLVCDQSSTLPSAAPFLQRLAHILEKRVMHGSRFGDGLQQEIQLHDKNNIQLRHPQAMAMHPNNPEEKRVMQGSRCGDGRKQEIQLHDNVGGTVKRKRPQEEELCGTTSK
ncbi:hypothetical protein OROMI_015719 [Orobanche minor]